ncbi:MAG: NUDIX domain-containing protein [Mycobacteriales bacterium]
MIFDAPRRYPVSSSRPRYESGRVINVWTDQVQLPGGQEVTRDVVGHPGAVGVICLDDHERVLLLQQYRHPAGHLLWEPPAGLLDIPGEDPRQAAARELAEEAGVRAHTWHVLVDAFTSPGMTNESVRLYLARDLETGAERSGEGEEQEMPLEWVGLDQAVAMVLAGVLHNPMAVMGVLATFVSRGEGFRSLRPAAAPWPARAARE